MTVNSFIEKYFKQWADRRIDLETLLITLDELYINFTKEQVIEIVTTFYDNADKIINNEEEK